VPRLNAALWTSRPVVADVRWLYDQADGLTTTRPVIDCGNRTSRVGENVNVSEALAYMGELGCTVADAVVETGTAGRAPHDYAYLKLTSPDDPETYAIVSTPGVGWFELEVTGGFRTGQADDLGSDETVQEYLNYYLRAARAYLEGRWSAASSRLLRLPIVRVEAEDRTLTLKRSVREDLKHMLRMPRQ
jgi:hypothetical protein